MNKREICCYAELSLLGSFRVDNISTFVAPQGTKNVSGRDRAGIGLPITSTGAHDTGKGCRVKTRCSCGRERFFAGTTRRTADVIGKGALKRVRIGADSQTNKNVNFDGITIIFGTCLNLSYFEC